MAEPPPYSRGWKVPKDIRTTRGTPITKLDTGGFGCSTIEYALIAKLNEIIDRINQMNEVTPRG